MSKSKKELKVSAFREHADGITSLCRVARQQSLFYSVDSQGSLWFSCAQNRFDTHHVGLARLL
jgi:hypothetical protein